MEPRTKRLTQVMGAVGIAVGLGLGAAGLASAATSSDSPSTKTATITPEQAKQTALAALPGTVNEVELDHENGADVYSVEITANGQTRDVKVDPVRGTVVSNAPSEDGHGESGTDPVDTPDSGSSETTD